MKSLDSNTSEKYERPEMLVILFSDKNVICASILVDTDFGNGEEDGGITFQ